jgi:DNA-binding NtrC family response regulator
VPKRILLVEDDAAVRRSLARALGETYDVALAESAEQALAHFAESPSEVVLTDVRMPGMDGVELLRTLRARVPDVDVIVMTAYEDMATVARVMREGAFDFLVKPLKQADVLSVLDRAFRDRDTRELARRAVEGAAADYRLEALVGRSAPMIEVYKLVGQFSAGRVNVLIRGETGTGKGVVARAIHYNSAQASEPFVAVNCTAVPESLLESELFGHVRGAFTGAVSDRRGRFALAGGGTIFLDEVGDTTPEFQAKLLRVLEEREFYPVGAERPERTEARVIAATHRDLERQVAQGRFREDLYYRLRVVEIVVPPLRDRLEDVSLLAKHFIRKASRELHRAEPALPQETLDTLLGHGWPGNVRELENTLVRCVVLASGNVIRPEHLAIPASTAAAPLGERLPTLEEMEGQHLRRALAAAGGNRTRAAKILGVSKPRLYRLLEKHGVT